MTRTLFALPTLLLALLASLAILTNPVVATAEDVNVYTTPGYHTVNGREWHTTCSQYDANITRCRAEIKSEGKWVFNNLTYLATDHANWYDNDLAKAGFFTSARRQWVTSCNDSWTGPNACRTFIFSGDKWVFNNLVYFTPGTADLPPSSFDQQKGVLTVDGKITNPPESLNRGYSSGLDYTNENTKKVIRHVWANYPEIKTMYGWRRDVTPDHPAGRAVDVMIPNWRKDTGILLGWEIALYYKQHASEFGISYIIWDQRIWSVSRDSEGWRPMDDRGNDTANHLDHVHINTYDS